MFVSLYLNNYKTSYKTPYNIVILYGGTTTFSLTSTPTHTPIKSYTVGFQSMLTIFSFGILPISSQSFILMKGDIAQMIDLLEPNLLLLQYLSFSFLSKVIEGHLIFL